MKQLIYALYMILILPVVTVYSQSYFQREVNNFITTIEYSSSFNTGRAADYISAPGYAGIGVGFKRFINPNVTVGGYLGWDVQGKELEGALLELENGAIYGRQARYLNYFSILANSSYYFTKLNKSRFVPYVQLNVGAYYIYQRFEVGFLQVNNDNWHIGGAPELGLIAVLGRNLGVSVNARYNYAFSSGKTLRSEDKNSYSFININVGLAYFR